MRKIALAALVLATCQSFSSSIADKIAAEPSTCAFAVKGGIALPAGKYFHNGKEIVFIKDPGNWYGASAHYLKGRPEILYDPVVLSRYPTILQAYTFQHEIGHIKLDHHARNLSIYPAELEADCFAAKKMKKMGCSKEQMVNIYIQIPLFDKYPEMGKNFWRCYDK